MNLQLTDIAIFLISFAACIYCIVLSRRLAKLQDTKDGLGATIVACSNSISSVSAAAKGTTAQARLLADELSELLSRADRTCQRIEKTTSELEMKNKAAISKSTEAQAKLTAHMHGVLELNKKHILEIATLTRQLKPASGATVPTEDTHTERFKSATVTQLKGRSA